MGVPVRERRRRRTHGPLQLRRQRAVLSLRGVRSQGRARNPAAGRSRRRRIPIRCDCSKKSSPHTAPRMCRACRASAAGPSAMRATTRCAMSSICPTPPRTTAGCPTCRSPSTIAWSMFDHIDKTIAAVAHAHDRCERPAKVLRRCLRQGRSAWSSDCSRAWPICN